MNEKDSRRFKMSKKVKHAFCNMCGIWSLIGIFNFSNFIKDLWICKDCLSHMANEIKE